MDIDADIADRVMNAIAKGIPMDRKEINLESDFEKMELESIDIISVIFAIEDEFTIDIPIGEETDISNVRDMTLAVQKLLSEKT